jgi:hypothetical protein
MKQIHCNNNPKHLGITPFPNGIIEWKYFKPIKNLAHAFEPFGLDIPTSYSKTWISQNSR